MFCSFFLSFPLVKQAILLESLHPGLFSLFFLHQVDCFELLVSKLFLFLKFLCKLRLVLLELLFRLFQGLLLCLFCGLKSCCCSLSSIANELHEVLLELLLSLGSLGMLSTKFFLSFLEPLLSGIF